MNIVLPIISNLLIVITLVLGILVGIKNEWKLSLTKLLISLGFAVGLYFLNPTLVSAISKIAFIDNLLQNELITKATLTACTFSVSFVVLFVILSIIMLAIRHHRNEVRYPKSQNMVLTKRAKAIDKNTEKVLKKEDIKARKLKRKELARQHKKARVFGAILETLTCIILVFVAFIPVKYVVKNELKDVQTIETVYDYTPIGQLDKATNVVEFIVKGE